MACPIMIEKEIIGSLCLVATGKEQRQRLLANEETYIKFLSRMCLLISNTVSERKTRDELGLLLKRYDNVTNSVQEGIIATDESGRVIHCNLSAGSLLGIEVGETLGKQLSSIFPDLPEVAYIIKKKIIVTELCCRYKEGKRYFLASVAPVMAENDETLRGITLSFRSLSEVQSYAIKMVNGRSRYSFDDIQGISVALEEVKQKLGKAALTNSTILIRGESGTGKELFAHSVHSASNRVLRPFIAINCSAIPESLLESELFGYDEGAFTGAKKGGKPGKFELTGGGTLFLDEIGDMPLHLQSKLLRVLESHSIERVGGTESITVDVRIIAATHRNLEAMIERREFRDDLYYRLSVIPVFVPPLRERPEDIPVMIDHFLNTYCKKFERDSQALDLRARTILTNYSWPGNVRELQNTIEYAVNMSELGQMITVEHLPQRILAANGDKYHQNQTYGNLSEYVTNSSSGNLKAIGKSLEVETIRETLKRFGSNTTGKKKAARYLGVSLTTLYRRLRQEEGDF
jgi:transcriptional regulator with PAS, ATPase and Fis domain